MKMVKLILALLLVSTYALAQESDGKVVGILKSDNGYALRVVQDDVQAKDLDSATLYHLEFVSRVYTSKSGKKFRNIYLIAGQFTFEQMCAVVDQSGVSCAYLASSLKNGTADTWNDVLKPEVKEKLENLGALGIAGLVFFGYPEPEARKSVYDRATEHKTDAQAVTVSEAEIRRLSSKAGVTVSDSGISLTKNIVNITVGGSFVRREEVIE